MPVSEFFRRSKRKNRITVNFKFVNSLLSVLAVIGVIYYVAGVNNLAIKGFELQELKNDSSSLQNDNKDFNIHITSLKSYNNLAKRVEKMGMVEIGRVDYIRKDASVALR